MKTLSRALISFLILSFGFLLSFNLSQVKAGSEHDIFGWAWSENIGWLSFNSINCDANNDGKSDGTPTGCPAAGTTMADYGVNIDSSSGDFSGYAWSENLGWISFNRSDTGDPPSNPYKNSGAIARLNPGNGEVKGWARVLSIGGGWDGWIRFCDNTVAKCSGANQIAKVNSDGSWQGWAWSDMVVGWISLADVIYNAAPNKPSLSSDISYCSGLAGIGLVNFSWDYQDPDNDPQAYYQIQVERTSYPAGLLVDCQVSQTVSSGQQGTSAVRIVSSPTAALCDLPSFVGDIDYNASFRAKVRVKDSDGLWSDWSGWLDFSTQSHASPFVDFSWSPQNPAVGEKTLFSDESIAYGGAVISGWSWTFSDATPTASSEQDPEVVFASAGTKNITLVVSDSHGFSCSDSTSLILQLSFPKWKEILPW
jgi:hypothetical protein